MNLFGRLSWVQRDEGVVDKTRTGTGATLSEEAISAYTEREPGSLQGSDVDLLPLSFSKSGHPPLRCDTRFSLETMISETLLSVSGFSFQGASEATTEPMHTGQVTERDSPTSHVSGLHLRCAQITTNT